VAYEYQKLQDRPKEDIGNKTYYSKDVTDKKKKGIKGLLQRLIPGGETGMERVVKHPEVAIAREIDKQNRETALAKRDYILKGTSKDKTAEVAGKTIEALDYKDSPTDVRQIVELIARQKAEAEKEAEFMNTDYEGGRKVKYHDDGSVGGYETGVKHEDSYFAGRPNQYRENPYPSATPERFMGKSYDMQEEMDMQRVKKMPFGSPFIGGDKDKTSGQNRETMRDYMRMHGGTLPGIPEGDTERLLEFINSYEGEFVPRGTSIDDYYQAMLKGERPGYQQSSDRRNYDASKHKRSLLKTKASREYL
jgi:hypothetical protein